MIDSAATRLVEKRAGTRWVRAALTEQFGVVCSDEIRLYDADAEIVSTAIRTAGSAIQAPSVLRSQCTGLSIDPLVKLAQGHE